MSIIAEGLIEGEYYKINGSKRVLYWDGNKWMKPIKDQQKNYGSLVCLLEKQPKIKSFELTDRKLIGLK